MTEKRRCPCGSGLPGFAMLSDRGRVIRYTCAMCHQRERIRHDNPFAKLVTGMSRREERRQKQRQRENALRSRDRYDNYVPLKPGRAT